MLPRGLACVHVYRCAEPLGSLSVCFGYCGLLFYFGSFCLLKDIFFSRKGTPAAGVEPPAFRLLSGCTRH